jgi:ATP/maltotriose-dependent transcriptional regulator MalT
MLEETSGAYTKARILMYLAELEATRGRYAEARELYEQSNALMAKVGDVRELACGIAFSCSWVELVAGDFIASEQHARSGCETFQRLEASGYLSSALNCIIEALIPQGKLDDARQIMSTATSLLNDPHDIDAIERQARARALIELTAGDPAAAERSARLAVETALQADYVCEQAVNWLVLADSLTAAGREPEARDAAAEALATAEHKGHALYTARARSILSTPTAKRLATSSARS